MPDVGTAPTATAAQTSAAGTKFLGYYLGVGSVKVDALFDTANFLTKSTSGTFTASASLSLSSATDVKITLRGSDAPGIEAFNIANSNLGRLEFTSTGPNIRAAVGASVSLLVAGVNRLDVSSTAVTATVPILVPLGGGPSAPTYSFTTDTDTGMFRYASDHLAFATGGVMRYYITSAGHMVPIADNTYSLGTGANRMSVIYAGTGTINISDGTEKTEMRVFSAPELAAAKRIGGSIGIYQWLASVAEKGEAVARLHVGVIAQEVWAIMADEGLIDPIAEGMTPSSRYAFLCYDAWEAVEAVAEERDDEGNITVEAVEPREAGNRFGIRPDQLALFLIAAQEARLAALEAA